MSKEEYAIDVKTGCWEWQRSKAGNYGHKWVGGKTVYSHVWYYEQEYGKVPEGLEIDHKCKNPSCCNPDHLEAVTSAENSYRSSVAKLTKEKVKIIRDYGGIIPKKDLAWAFFVDVSTISRILNNKTWLYT